MKDEEIQEVAQESKKGANISKNNMEIGRTMTIPMERYKRMLPDHLHAFLENGGR